jgi:hypothetical protein
VNWPLVSNSTRQGFGLISVLIATSLSSFLVFGIMRAGEMSSRILKRDRLGHEIEFYVQEIRDIVGQQDLCALNFSGQNASDGSILNDKVQIYDSKDKTFSQDPSNPGLFIDRDTETVFQSGRAYGGTNFTFESIKLNSDHPEIRGLSGHTMLEVTVNRESSNGKTALGGNIMMYHLRLRYVANTADEIIFCGAGSVQGDRVPIGAIMAFNKEFCPPGWALADGRNHSSAGELPDLRGRFIRGVDTSGLSIDVDGKRALRNIQNDGVGDHKHNYLDWSNDCNRSDNGENTAPGFCRADVIQMVPRKTIDLVNPIGESRPKNVALRYCIFVND